jgi:hypothetical protein
MATRVAGGGSDQRGTTRKRVITLVDSGASVRMNALASSVMTSRSPPRGVRVSTVRPARRI